MKYIAAALFAFLLWPATAHATQVGNDQANNYYKSCLSQPMDARITEDSHKSLCACTSAQMVKNMSVEDVNAMRGNDQNARIALNKMLTDVYAPCMGDVVHDLMISECNKNPAISGANASTICECFAKLTGDWYSLSGRTIMAEELKKNPNLIDPTEAIQNSALFKTESMKNLQSCMRGQ